MQESRRYLVHSPFLQNFVPIATRVSRVKFDWQHSLAHPRNPLYRLKNLSDIFYTSRVMANFVPNFVAMATREGLG